MKRSAKLRNRWKGMIDTVLRFPLTVILLIAAAVSDAIEINLLGNDLYQKLTVTFIVGASINAVLQLLCERSGMKSFFRYLFMGAAIILSFLYYLSIRTVGWTTQTTVRTTVILFILLIAFLWVPVIKSKVNFNESFMAAFKGFFMTAFFHGILFLGTAVILSTINLLLFTVNEKAYMHSANIIFVIFAPIYFLSMIPYYPGKGVVVKADQDIDTLKTGDCKDDTVNQGGSENEMVSSVPAGKSRLGKEEFLMKQITPAKFLEALISYVIIPIAAVFTIILLLYIITNITGEFWSDNLMEPLLVSYSIVVIIVYLLASTIHNAFTKYFCMVFPKVLVPVVLFQTISSILKIQAAGITYGRYYVILFGIFATVAGVLFCIRPVSKNGLIAPVLIILSVISILPVVNAFTVSKANQIGRLENTLRRNDMLSDDLVKPTSDIPQEDKKTIISSVQYLNNLGYTKDVKWLSTYQETNNFELVFGFPMYESGTRQGYTYSTVSRDQSSPIPVEGYDFIAHMSINSNYTGDKQNVSYVMDGRTFYLGIDSSPDNGQSIVLKEEQKEINRFPLEEIYHKLEYNNGTQATEKLTFIKDNPASTLAVVADNITIDTWDSGSNEAAEVFILVKIK